MSYPDAEGRETLRENSQPESTAPEWERWKHELAWAAGLFEGEGFFRYAVRTFQRCDGSRGGRRYGQRIGAGIQMADEDVLRRFHAAVGFGRFGGPYRNGLTKMGTQRRPMFQWNANTFERTQALVAFFWNDLGERRKAKATEVLRAYTAWAADSTAPTGGR